MKFLTLIRHAKSSWDEPSLSDFDRPLNKKGKNSIKLMGKFLEKKKKPELVVSSPAKRALSTAKGICKLIDYDKEKVLTNSSIYHASVQQLLKTVNGFEDKYDRITLVGHNPGLTDLYNYLLDDDLGNIPTCGIACIGFNVNTWKAVSAGTGTLEYFETPRSQGLESD